MFRDAPYFGCDMNELMDEVRGNMTLGEYYASHNDDHYGTLHEEIVRCRDCKHFEKDATPHDEWYPHFCSKLGTDVVTPGGFCAWGERKEDE